MITRLVSILQSLSVCMLFVTLIPAGGQAEVFRCTAGDVGCVIASMAKANANGPEHDYLYLQAGTYRLTRADNTPPNDSGNGLPVNTGALTILGAGQGVTWLGRDPTAPPFRIFDNAPTGGLTIYGVTIAQGETALRFFYRGGCIQNAGSMMLIAVTVRECAAWVGGGIDTWGELLIQHSVIIEHFAEYACGAIAAMGTTVIERGTWIGDSVAQTGGGVCSGHLGPLIIRNSVLDGHVATLLDGGCLSGNSSIEIRSTLVSECFSALRGGGLHLYGGTMTVRNSTIWDNAAEIDGGGLYVDGGEAHLTDVAVLFNSAGIPGIGNGSGGGIKIGTRGIVHLARVWLLFNEAASGPECSGTAELEGWAVIGTPNRFHPAGESPCN